MEEKLASIHEDVDAVWIIWCGILVFCKYTISFVRFVHPPEC